MGRVQVEGEICCVFFSKDQGFAKFMDVFLPFSIITISEVFLPNLLSFIIFYQFRKLIQLSKTFSSIPLKHITILGFEDAQVFLLQRYYLGYS